MNEAVLKQYEKAPRTWIVQLGVLFLFIIIFAWSGSTIELSKIPENGLQISQSILQGIVTPETSLLLNFTTKGVPYLLLETIAIAFLGTLVGAILAIPFSFISATNIVPKPVAIIGRTAIMAIRTVPTLIYGLMFIRVTGPGAFTGLLTMSVASIGMISKLYIEAIEDLDYKILESLDASGCNLYQKIRFGILPQLIPSFISTVIYRFDMNLRDATVLGMVGAGGIGSPLMFAMSAYKWNEVGAILCGLIILVLFIEFVSTKIRTRLARG